MKRPILYILVPLILGIAASSPVKIPLAYLIFGFAISAVAGLIFLKNRVISHLALYLTVFFLGAACYQNALILPRNHISNFTQDEPKKIFLKGVIVDDPFTADTPYNLKKTSFTFSTANVNQSSGERIGWQNASGLVKVDLYSKSKPSYYFGDELVLEGLISRPVALRNPGLFDYSKYLGIKNIYSVFKVKENFFVEKLKRDSAHFSIRTFPEKWALSLIKAISYRLRRVLREAIDSHFDGYNASFLKAIYIGDRTGLGDDIKDDFIKTGTVHILAISGLHVGLIAGIILAFFGILRVPKRWNLVLTLIFLIFYTFTAGANPPIIRAVAMFFIFVIGYLINRDTDLLNSLSAAALLILLWNPKELFDPSFQLSFISVAGIIVFCPVIDRWFGVGNTPPGNAFGKTRRYVLKSVSISIAAWFGTFPVVAAYFNIISPVAVIANLVIIPILFILTAFSFVFFIASQICSNFSAVLCGLIFIIEQSLFLINQILAQIPLSNFRIPAPSGGFLIIYYCLISLLILPDVIGLNRLKIYKKHIFIGLLCSLNIFVWAHLYKSSGRDLKITFLDVGQGDSIFIRLPQKGNILIDAGTGAEENRFDTGRSVVAPYLWNAAAFEIDAVVVTHFHEDHLGGIIYILKNFKVGCVVDNGAKAGEPGLFITFEESRQNILDNIPEAMRKDLDALSEKAWFFDLS
ncbi:MAG: ComEC/Rec2 family competence protein, partial [Candidatus Omnitrophica bacterium]|nr:ComEC/Rec2 family competence protein [Candidatus Omnitrophota bacterium]